MRRRLALDELDQHARNFGRLLLADRVAGTVDLAIEVRRDDGGQALEDGAALPAA